MKMIFSLLFALFLTILSADEISAYSKMFEILSQKPGCTGTQVFQQPEWQDFFRAAKKDPKLFKFLLAGFPDSKSTRIHICNWENASQGVLAVMSAEMITGRSWMSYDGDDPDIRNAVKVAETHFPRHSSLKTILANPKSCRGLQNFFLRAYHRRKQSEIPQAQNKTPAAAMKEAGKEYIPKRKCVQSHPGEDKDAAF